MHQEPLHQAVNLTQSKQQQLIVAANVLKQSKGNDKLTAAELVQQIVSPDSKQLLPAVAEIVEQEVVLGNPSDIIARLWFLQADPLLWDRPNERIEKIKASLSQYLIEIGMARRLPTITQEVFQGFASLNKSSDLIYFFCRHYPNWLKIQHAIEDGSINDELDYWRWKNQGCPVKFKWKRLKDWWLLKRRMPPAWRANPETDPEYRADLFSPKPRTIFLRPQQEPQQ